MKEDFQIELLGVFPLEECLKREKELAMTSLFPKGINGNAGKSVVHTTEVRKKISLANKKRLEDKTHNFCSENQRIYQKKRVEQGTHPFLGPGMNRRRIEDGSLSKLSSKVQTKMVEDGTHPFLGSGMMTAYNSETGKVCRISTEDYRLRKDIYHHLRSKYVKELFNW